MIVQNISVAVQGCESTAQISNVQFKSTRHDSATCDESISINFLKNACDFYH
jgi:hypothetical protein